MFKKQIPIWWEQPGEVEDRTTRRNDPLFRDLIRILILNDLLNRNRTHRPPMPGPGRPPMGGPGTGRPPMGGPRPGFRDYEDYLQY